MLPVEDPNIVADVRESERRSDDDHDPLQALPYPLRLTKPQKFNIRF